MPLVGHTEWKKQNTLALATYSQLPVPEQLQQRLPSIRSMSSTARTAEAATICTVVSEVYWCIIGVRWQRVLINRIRMSLPNAEQKADDQKSMSGSGKRLQGTTSRHASPIVLSMSPQAERIWLGPPVGRTDCKMCPLVLSRHTYVTRSSMGRTSNRGALSAILVLHRMRGVLSPLLLVGS